MSSVLPRLEERIARLNLSITGDQGGRMLGETSEAVVGGVAVWSGLMVVGVG